MSVNCNPLLRLSCILGRTLCVVLRGKDLIQIGRSCRGSYWRLQVTLTSGQAAFKFGNLDVSISWFLVATENVFPRQRPQTDVPWTELNHPQFGFLAFSSDWSQAYCGRRLNEAKATSVHEPILRQTGELLLTEANRCQVGRNVSCLPQGRSHSLLEKWRLA